jgi:hypothetical protein
MEAKYLSKAGQRPAFLLALLIFYKLSGKSASLA